MGYELLPGKGPSWISVAAGLPLVVVVLLISVFSFDNNAVFFS
jgi:hypothetical protein